MDKSEIESLIRLVPLFSGLTPQDRMLMVGAVVVRRFSTGQTIVYEDERESQTFFMIANGTVEVTVFSSEGRKTTLATLRKGAYFGEMSLLDGEPRSASVVAATDCQLLLLYRRDFLDLLRRCPEIAVRMLAEFSGRLRKANRHISTLSLMSVYGRIAEVILRLSKEEGRREGNLTIIPNRPTHQAIADRVGTSRETVSRVLSQLQKKGYVSLDRKRLVILNEAKLCT